MKKIIFISVALLAVFIAASITYQNSVQVGTPAYAACFSSDVRERCCPIACETKKKDGGEKANNILKNCMATVLQCSKSEYEYASTHNNCDCK